MSLLAKTQAQEKLIYKPASWLEPFRWVDVFSDHSPPVSESAPYIPHSPIRNPQFMIHVDLGAGDGGFIRARAHNYPETRFLAVERLLGRVRKLARRASQESLENLRVLRIEAAYAVEFLIPPKSVNSMTILFPDPWPKRRHHPNRLIQTSFLDLCSRCLTSEGWIGIKTDDVSYFEHIQKALRSCKTLKSWSEANAAELLPEITDFEKDFQKEGRPIYFVAARPV
jgi:tRNA (guanine-N7-)-methyltransferase